jgi:hypothetical protein
MSASPPICHAILICDVVYVDPVSQRVSLLGLLDETPSSRALERPIAFSVYCLLAGGRGRIDLELEFCRVDRETFERNVLSEGVVAVDFASSPSSVAVTFRFEDLDIHEAGEYGFTLLAGTTVVAERWLRVTE